MLSRAFYMRGRKELSMSYYLHHIPGRLRVKTPHVKKNRFIAEEIKRLLSAQPGILFYEINTVTGSIVINYDSREISEDMIIRMLEEAGHFDSSRAISNDYYIHTAVSRIGHTAVSLLTTFI